jgi:hypothetical protein
MRLPALTNLNFSTINSFSKQLEKSNKDININIERFGTKKNSKVLLLQIKQQERETGER